ncbi:hypothetical protein MJO28_006513 [Puccinia striiformis f. sp. tritici]|uniref:Uncharacterized protein n=3 Tax=Puccinia striiformis TaxID=27350 RepID=A0A2S4UIM3_9BASI|nr:hypothetical protein MJO28_006513 [Puccinia striiformis f. sp. tritici]KAI7958273.1 hypothetical protein MJO29_006490 [Puccinia striiformis f. sp. tritici]POV96183.1 hypothetical protein PSTT_15781 [Puccinia striiformis]POV97162.1 hypothetical protein PSHT_14724 [Puccinia striiformis]
MVSHPPQPGPSNSRSSQAPNQTLSTEPPQTLKLLLIGSSSVGKSSLLLRFTDELFLSAEESSATIGVDFKFKLIDHKGKRYKLSIWDTAGQERFRTLTSSYYRGAQGVLLVYDVTNRASFESLPSWFSELDTFAHSPQDVVRVIVGNKVDKDESRTVTTEEGQAFASDNHAMFFETSVKTRKGVDEVFEAVVDKLTSNPNKMAKIKQIIDSIALQRTRQGYRNDSRALPGSIDLDAYSDDDQAGSWCNC